MSQTHHPLFRLVGAVMLEVFSGLGNQIAMQLVPQAAITPVVQLHQRSLSGSGQMPTQVEGTTATPVAPQKSKTSSKKNHKGKRDTEYGSKAAPPLSRYCWQLE